MEQNYKDDSMAHKIGLKELEALIDEFIIEGGAQEPSKAINTLLVSWFTHPDRNDLIALPNESADMVYISTRIVNFIVALHESWMFYKTQNRQTEDC